MSSSETVEIKLKHAVLAFLFFLVFLGFLLYGLDMLVKNGKEVSPSPTPTNCWDQWQTEKDAIEHCETHEN